MAKYFVVDLDQLAAGGPVHAELLERHRPRPAPRPLPRPPSSAEGQLDHPDQARPGRSSKK